MTIFKSMIVAFSMYSKIPMPRIDWNKENMKYALCFFPWIGGVIGFMVILWASVSTFLGFNTILFAAVASLIPVIISGGIHMDGYCDTVDGLSSNQTKERKLEILADPNSGAFAIIKANGYYLLYFALFTQLDKKNIIIVSLGYVISRTISGLSVVNLKSAKTGGLLHEFKDKANRKMVTIVLAITYLIVAIAMIKLHIFLAIFCIVTSLLVFLYWRYMAYKEFGGITGDLAGYFLQQCELAILFAVIIAQGVIGIWN